MSVLLYCIQSKVCINTYSVKHLLCNQYFRNLELIGIQKARDYRLGDWFGNSSSSGYQIFRYVTHNLSDLLQSSSFKYKSGLVVQCDGDFKCLNFHAAREIGHPTYGRCFEIDFKLQGKDQDTIFIADIKIKNKVYMFFNMPHNFLNEDSRSKFEASPGQNLFIDVSYEILQDNFRAQCKKYPKTFDGSYDECKVKQIERRIVSELNCTTPFINEPTLTDVICLGEKARNASDSFMDLANKLMPTCPDPCINMLTTFGFPLLSQNDMNSTGGVRLYFKSIVKFTEDFVSYNMLRLKT